LINLRYHIVSITAVFLALGIGLTLGSTFLDRVTVDNLKGQLDEVQDDVDRTQAANADLRGRVDALEERDGALAEALGERLVTGRLADVPVLVIAAEGTDEELVDQAVTALDAAGADLAGTWWLTERWLLDDPEEVRDLEELLQLRTDDADRLRRNGSIRLADALLESTAPVEEPLPDVGVEGEPVEPTQPAEPREPDVAAALVESGFLEYTSAPGEDGPVLLPPAGLRIVTVSSTDPASGGQQISLGLLAELTGDGAAPVVAAQGLVDVLNQDGTPAPEGDRRSTFVGPLRDGELTRDRVSTVDDLDTAAGLLAVILAVEDAGDLRLGHYGVAPGAASLLPGP